MLLTWLLGVRYIPHDKVGVVEKMWSLKGSLASGHLIALSGEAGFQASILRGGLHFLYVPWQYRIHKVPLVVVSEGRIGYVYARDGQPLPATQTLARSVDCNHFSPVVIGHGGLAPEEAELDGTANSPATRLSATEALGRRFRDYDINCVAVLIGRPESKRMVGGEDPIDRLFDQLRLRRLAEEQKATYAKQEKAALQLRELNNAQAAATRQTELTQTRVDVEIAGNRRDAQLAEARRLARRDVARAAKQRAHGGDS